MPQRYPGIPSKIRMLASCHLARPAFVKIGQALSARPDLLPKVYLETLSGLQDQLPPFPTEVAYAGACGLGAWSEVLRTLYAIGR